MRGRQFLLLVGAIVILGSSLVERADAITRTWTGTTNAQMNNTGNWDTTAAVATQDDMIFGSSTRLGPTNNTANNNVYSITFSSAASGNTAGYTLAGTNSFDLKNTGIVNQSTWNQTINTQLRLSTSSVFDAASGNLTFGGTNAIVLQANNILTVQGANNTTISRPITGTGTSGITKTGAGTLILGGTSNTYTGGTIINGGKLQLASAAVAGALGTGTLTVNTNGTFDLNGNTFTLPGLSGTGSGTVRNTNATAATLTVGSDNTPTTYQGAIITDTGVINLIKAGTGMLTLSGVNTYTGSTTVNGGVLRVSSTGSIGAGAGISVNAGGVLQVDWSGALGGSGPVVTVNAGGAAALGPAYTDVSGLLGRITSASAGALALTSDCTQNLDFSGAGALALGASGGTVTMSGNLTPSSNTYRLGGGGGTLIVSSNLTGGARSVVIGSTGSTGTVVLSGANDYGGSTTVAGGILRLDSVDALPGSVLVAAGGTLAPGPSVNLATLMTQVDSNSGGTVAIMKDSPDDFNLSGAANLSLGAAGPTPMTYGGTLTPYNNTYKLGGGGGTLNISNVGGAGQTLIVGGSGTGGTVSLRGTNAPDSTTVGKITTADPAGVSFTATLALDNGATLTTHTLTLGDNSTSNAATLNANLNLINGTLKAQTVQAGSSTAGTITRAVNWTAGTIQNYNTLTDLTWNGPDIVLAAAGARTLQVDSGRTMTINGRIIGTASVNAVTKAGPGKLVLPDTSAENSNLALDVQDGAVELGKTTAGVRAVYSLANVAATATVKITGTNGDQIYGASAINSGVNGLSGTLDLNGNSESISYLNGSTTGVVKSSTGTPTLTVGETNTSSTFAGVIQDAVSVTKTGTGTFTMSGNTASTYNGNTTVSTGILVLAKTSGNALAGTVTIGDATGADILRIGAANQQFPTGTVLNFKSGTTNANSAKFELNGYDQTVGGLSVVGTTSVIQNVDSGTPAGNTTATLTVNVGTTNTSWSSNLRNNAGANDVSVLALTKAGTATLTLSGTGITYTGPTTIQSGTLALGAANFASAVAFGSASTGTLEIGAAAQSIAGLSTDATVVGTPVVQNAAGTDVALTVNEAGNTTYGGTIRNNPGGNTLALVKSGAGVLTITGAGNHTGGTTISGGVLQVASPGTIVNGTGVKINTGGTLQLDRPAALGGSGASVTINAGGTLAASPAYNTDYTNLTGTLMNRIVNTSEGTVALMADSAESFDFSNGALNFAKLCLGAAGTTPVTYSGALTTYDDNVYRLGGGGGTLIIPGALTGVSRSLAVGNAGAAGALVLTSPSTYGGDTTLQGGALRLAHATALPGGVGVAGGTSNLTFNGGVIELTTNSGNFSRALGTGADQVQWLGSGGFAAYGQDATVNLGGNADQVLWDNTPSFVKAGSTLILGSPTADKTITFANPINLAGDERTIQVNKGSGSATFDARLTGALSGGKFTKTGTGNLRLEAASSTLDQLILGSSIGTNNPYPAPVPAGMLTVAGGTALTVSGGNFFLHGGSMTVEPNATLTVDLLNVGSVSIGQDSADKLIVRGALRISGTGGAGMDIALGRNATTAATAELDASAASLVDIDLPWISFGAGNAPSVGVMKLSSNTNTIKISTLFVIGNDIGAGDKTIVPQQLVLAGTTTLTTPLLTMARSRISADVRFDPARPGGTFTLTDTDGKSDLYVTENNTPAIAQVSVGTMELIDGTFNATLGTLAVGWSKSTDVNGGARGTLTLGSRPGGPTYNHNVTADNVYLGYSNNTNPADGNVTGTLNLLSGTLKVNTTISENGGTRGQSTLNLDGGTLDMAPDGSSASITVDTFNARSGTLRGVSAITTTAGTGLTKTATTGAGSNTLVLAGTNAYTGLTDVQVGTLQLGNSSAIPAASAVSVSGGTLDMSTFTNTVAAVTLTDGSIIGTGPLTSTAGFAVKKGTISANLAGGVGLTKDTPDLVTLSGHNTYSGGTLVNNGTVTFANALALPPGSNVTATGSGVVVFSSGYTGVITSSGPASAPATDSPNPVPEPGTLALLAAAALCGLAAWRRRK